MKSTNGTSNVAMILYKYYSSDTRVLRESIILADNGYSVDVINLANPKSETPTLFKHEGISDIQIMKVSVKKRENIVKLLFFWLKSFVVLIKMKKKFDIIHCHDLTGLPAGVLYKIFKPKVKLIYDSHELFPEAAFDKLNRFYWFSFLILEKICCLFVDTIIGASDLQLNIMKKRFKSKKFCLLLNVPDIKNISSDILSMIQTKKIHTNEISKIKIVYSGQVLPFRGYDIFVEVASRLCKSYRNLEFWVVGGGPYLDTIKRKVKEKNVESIFVFTGNVLFEDLLKILIECDFGVCFYEHTINNNVMISNKIFEYMLVGLPFAFSNLKSSIPIINAVGALSVNPSNINEIYEVIAELISSQSLREKISKKSLSLINSRYNWEIESKKLLEAYKRFY